MGFLKDFYYGIKSFLIDSDICPRCGAVGFEHGYCPFQEYYCLKCGLWKPDFDALHRQVEEMLAEMKKADGAL